MELQLRIAARNAELTPDVEAAIRREAERLERFHPRIMGCRVLVEAEHRFNAGEVVDWAVRVDVTVPQGEIPTTRQSDPELWTAVQRAFDAARRQLQDFARVQRGDVGTPVEESRAKVAGLFPWEGYGFLETADGREIYFHRNSVLNQAFDRLEVGDEVRFAETEGEKGPQASTVSPVSPGRERRGRHSAA
jgi:cold shock CspA family protein/ribosome-associated translation inhibitor RaiA